MKETTLESSPALIASLTLKDRVALVTGGSRGIGRAAVNCLARLGANVVINYVRDEQAASETVKSAENSGVSAIAIRADVSRVDEAQRLIEKAVKRFEHVDFLICNAGIWEGGSVEALEDVWDRTMDLNLKGTWAACRAAVPEMKARGFGRIVIVSSTAGQRGEANVSNYAASKGGQISFAKSLAVELAPEIRINCVAPGWVDTDLNEGVFGEDGFKEKLTEAIPLRRIATADDVALSIVFLASEWAQHITGEVLNINGGAVLCG